MGYLTQTLLSYIFRKLHRMAPTNNAEVLELYAVLLASEVMLAREDMKGDQFEDDELGKALHASDERIAVEVVIERLGETMHTLLDERLTMIFQYREGEKPFGTCGGMDL